MSYGTGNFGDVIKHAILLKTVETLTQKNTYDESSPFQYIETHGSERVHNQLSGSAPQGFYKLRKLYEDKKPKPQQEYLNIQLRANSKNIMYYSSWWLVHEYLTKMKIPFKMCIHDNDVSVVQKVNQQIKNFPNVIYQHADGFEAVDSYIGGGQKADLVFIDPPYENEADDVKKTLSINEKLNLKKVNHLVWYCTYKNKMVSQSMRLKSKMPKFIEVQDKSSLKPGMHMHMRSTGIAFGGGIKNKIKKIRKDINYLNQLVPQWKIK